MFSLGYLAVGSGLGHYQSDIKGDFYWVDDGSGHLSSCCWFYSDITLFVENFPNKNLNNRRPLHDTGARMRFVMVQCEVAETEITCLFNRAGLNLI